MTIEIIPFFNGSLGADNTNNNSSIPYISDFIEFQVIPWYEDRRFLHQKYVVEGLSARQIANLIFSSRSTVVNHLKQFKIPLRTQEQNHQNNPGQVAFGQRLVNGRAVPNKVELAIIKKMIELRSQGLSYWKIAEMLNLWGVPTKNRSSNWHPTTVMKIVKAYRKVGS